jgi:non-ribosomal peptide synthetase component F
LRTDVAGSASFADLLALARETDLQAFAHADLPFERLVEILNPARSQARNPLFQVMLAFQNVKQANLELPGLSVNGIDYDARLAKFDLQLTLQETQESGEAAGMSAEISYALDLFDEDTVAAFARRLDRILAAIIADPTVPVGDIQLLDDEETALAVLGWNDTEHDLLPRRQPGRTPRRSGAHRTGGLTLVGEFAAQAAATPDAVAIVDPATGTALTYAEFGARVHRLARRLIEAAFGRPRGRGLCRAGGRWWLCAAGPGSAH